MVSGGEGVEETGVGQDFLEGGEEGRVEREERKENVKEGEVKEEV